MGWWAWTHLLLGLGLEIILFIGPELGWNGPELERTITPEHVEQWITMFKGIVMII